MNNSKTTLLAKGMANAKLTLTLRVLSKRQDGYNNIEALTSSFDGLRERLSIYEADSSSYGLKIISSPDQIDVDKTNLVNVAIEKFQTVLNSKKMQHKDFYCELEKQIPVRGGLGGGSVDAALTLRLLNDIYSRVLSNDELFDVASEIGSDVSACVLAKLCWMKSRGEVIEPVAGIDLHGLFALVITPDIGCSTPAVYAHYEKLGRPRDVGIQPPEVLLGICESLHNDLAIAAYDLYPELADFKAKLEVITKSVFQLAGSGSTLFKLGTHKELEHLKHLIEHATLGYKALSIGGLC